MGQQNIQTDEAIRIGMSSCLLGQEVRFDGGHKHDRYLTGNLASALRSSPRRRISGGPDLPESASKGAGTAQPCVSGLSQLPPRQAD
jgi:hypothetical protein